MADMQTNAGRVGEHVEDVALGPAALARGAERPVLFPVALPAGLDLEVVVGHVVLYPVAAGGRQRGGPPTRSTEARAPVRPPSRRRRAGPHAPRASRARA